MNPTLQIQETIRDILAVDPVLKVAGCTVVMQDQADFARVLEEGGGGEGARGGGGREAGGGGLRGGATGHERGAREREGMDARGDGCAATGTATGARARGRDAKLRTAVASRHGQCGTAARVTSRHGR